MAFLKRLFGDRGGRDYDNGIALVEQGRLGEAIPLLREVYAADSGSARGSLAGFYFRQALVGEGRRLLQAGDSDPACKLLGEAVVHWPEFPDLQFLAGAACFATRRWAEALEHAKVALRRNSDYSEARLLEAGTLHEMQRPREALTSLMALVESGRRVDHPLARTLAGPDGGPPESVPDDLGVHIRRAAVGDDAKRRLFEAVAQFQAGQVELALTVFGELAAEYPRYPDVRAKYGAALYQVGRSADALVEVEAALDVNDRYRTAVSLRGLVLAELGRLDEAAEFLQDAVPRCTGTAGRHEELFLAYLRAVLAFLLGDRDECRSLLGGWSDLGRQFARAELLLVACDDLDGWRDAASRRLEALLETWSADADLLFLRACMLLEERQWSAVEAALVQWPGRARQAGDLRPLLLQLRLDVVRGRAPDVPMPTDRETDAEGIHTLAWQQLAVHAHLLTGASLEAETEARALIEGGVGDEETGRLFLQALGEDPSGIADDVLAKAGPPDSWGPDLCTLWRQTGRGERAEDLATRRRQLRPERVNWTWLAAGFWLTPVRGWLA